MSNFINFHVLISHSPSCLNRDDMNMQKSAIFGGKRRVRISSQSLKRSFRKSDYYSKYFGSPSMRTKHLGIFADKIVKELRDQYDSKIVMKALEFASGKEGIDTQFDGDAVAPWVIGEIRYFCELLKNSDDKDLKDITKKIEKDSEGFRRTLESAIDVALSGRMATSGLISEYGHVDGALSVAHSITTHAVDADIDWFTAVDDLQELGSGHLDTQEFSSGVFYRYASLNVAQLQANLGNCSRERVLEIAMHIVHMIATVVPSAKQQSFAAHNLAGMVMISFSDLPISLANAFEKAIISDNQGGYFEKSVEAFHDYWAKIHNGYGLNERCAEFALQNENIPEGITFQKTLDNLKKWVKNDGK